MEQNSSGPPRLSDVQRWRRSRSDRMIAGVCGGIGRALDIDPVLVRVVVAVLALAGVGLPLYIACWLLMPEEGTDTAAVQSVLGDRVRPDHPWLWPAVICAAVFIGVGFASSSKMWPFSFPGWLIGGLIVYFLFRRKGSQRNTGDARPQDTPPTSEPHAASSVASSTPGPAATGTVASGAPGQPVWTEDDPLGLYVDEEPAPLPRPLPPPRRQGYRGVKPVIAGLTGLAIAIAWIAGSSVPAMMAVGLATLGAGMLVGGFLGRTLGLLPVGILLALAVISTSVFDSVPRKAGELKVVASPDKPIDATNSAYKMDLGSIRIDLRDAKFAKDAKVSARTQVGEIVVIVPPNADITGTLSSTTGELRVFGENRGGHNLELTIDDLGADKKPSADQKVDLDLDITLGSIRVERG